MSKLEDEIKEKDKKLKEKDAVIKEQDKMIKTLKLKTRPRSLGFYRMRFR